MLTGCKWGQPEKKMFLERQYLGVIRLFFTCMVGYFSKSFSVTASDFNLFALPKDIFCSLFLLLNIDVILCFWGQSLFKVGWDMNWIMRWGHFVSKTSQQSKFFCAKNMKAPKYATDVRFSFSLMKQRGKQLLSKVAEHCCWVRYLSMVAEHCCWVRCLRMVAKQGSLDSKVAY